MITCKLDLPTLPAVCQELIDEWKAVVSYLTLHAPTQQGQGARTRVGNLLKMAHSRVVGATHLNFRAPPARLYLGPKFRMVPDM